MVFERPEAKLTELEKRISILEEKLEEITKAIQTARDLITTAYQIIEGEPRK